MHADITGENFTARDLTVANTAGVDAGPAVAVRSAANRSIFYRCEFVGFQDTLLAESRIQLYKECTIHGTVDFIWGDATAVFQDCLIYVRKPQAGRHNVITAQGRDAPERDTGFAFQNCSVITRDDLTGVDTFLGRPWRNHSHVMIMQSYLDTIVNPQGWVTWKREDVAAEATRTVRYVRTYIKLTGRLVRCIPLISILAVAAARRVPSISDLVINCQVHGVR
jgi:pectinesterase